MSSNRVPTASESTSSGSKRKNAKRNLSDKGSKRALELAEDGQHCVRVTRRLGDGRFEVLCLGDGATRLAHVRDKLWWRVWVSTYDLVLVALRSFQDGKVDIVAAHVYRRGGAVAREEWRGARGRRGADRRGR